jgi:hypothetical protein
MCHRFEQRLEPAAESEVRSSTICPAAAKLPTFLDTRNMSQSGTSVQNLSHVTLATSLHESRAPVSTVVTIEKPSHTNLVRGDLQMATAAKFRIDVAIHDLLMNSTQRSPAPGRSEGSYIS